MFKPAQVTSGTIIAQNKRRKPIICRHLIAFFMLPLTSIWFWSSKHPWKRKFAIFLFTLTGGRCYWRSSKSSLWSTGSCSFQQISRFLNCEIYLTSTSPPLTLSPMVLWIMLRLNFARSPWVYHFPWRTFDWTSLTGYEIHCVPKHTRLLTPDWYTCMIHDRKRMFAVGFDTVCSNFWGGPRGPQGKMHRLGKEGSRLLPLL